MITATADMSAAHAALADHPTAARRAMARALNRGGTAARAVAVSAITATYAARTGDVRRMVTLTRATPQSLAVAVEARSGALPLGYFPHRPTAGGTGGLGRPPLRAEIRRGSRKPVPGAFVAPLRSGPRIMRRAGGVTRSGRAALESVFTVPLAVMLGVANVRAEVEARALEVAEARLPHELEFELGKVAR